jgi:hypothetical protein
MKKTASQVLVTRASRAARLGFFAALALGCVTTRRVVVAEPSEAALMPPSQEPVRLVLQTVSGDHLDIADHRGKAVLVLAFTTDHLVSQAMVRNLERVARRHPDSLAVIAIAGDTGSPSTLRAVLEAYRTVANLERVILTLAGDDVRNGVSALGLIEHVPTLFFLNRAGIISRRLEALLSEQQIETLIAPALPPGR